MKFNIILNSVEEAASLVKQAEKHDCDIELASGRFYVDAKSILGVVGMGVKRVMTMIIHDEPEAAVIKEELRSFMA